MIQRHNDVIQSSQKGYRACSSGSPRSELILYVSIEFITEISKTKWNDVVTFCNNIKTTTNSVILISFNTLQDYSEYYYEGKIKRHRAMNVSHM